MTGEVRKLTPSEAIQGYSVRLVPSEDAQPFSPYHDPRTGKVFARLPADAWSLHHYRSRGLRVGLPSGQPLQAGDKIEPENEMLRLLREMQSKIDSLEAKLKGATQPAGNEPPAEPVQLRLI